MLSVGNYDSAYNYFLKNILDKKINENRAFRISMNDLENIDSIGFFTRILLAEFRILGNKLHGTSEEFKYKYKKETNDFLVFLKEFSQRSPGDDRTRLIFNGDQIKIGIIFVAKKATLRSWGVDAHINRMKENCKKGVQRIFLFSYAQSFDEVMKNKEGYVVGVKRRREFLSLSQIEKKCKDLKNIRLMKKQKYLTKDSKGRTRSAKYLLYEVIYPFDKPV
jgi:hypothetical protein